MISQGEGDGGSRMSGDGVYRADRRFTVTDHQLPSILLLHITFKIYTVTVMHTQGPTKKDASPGHVR